MSIVGRDTKETSDVSRIRVDFSAWLDAGETIVSIQSLIVAAGVPDWVEEPDTPVLVDPTPLTVRSSALINTSTAVELFLLAGTPGNTYTVTMVVWGTSARQKTASVVIHILGTPPAATGPALLVANSAVSRLGDTMQGRLYLAVDPLAANEAATMRYVDAARINLVAGNVALVNVEASARTLADQTLTTAITVEATTRAAAVTAEAATRAAADTAEATARTAAISVEATARTAAIAAEATLRASAITTEAASRVSDIGGVNTAVAAEATARVSADAVLTTLIGGTTSSITTINGYITSLVASTTAINAALSAEITARTAIGLTGFRVLVGQATSGAGGLVTVTFSTAFTATPYLFLTAIYNANPGFAGSETFTAYAVSASQFSVGAYDRTGAVLVGAVFDWVAIGAT